MATKAEIAHIVRSANAELRKEITADFMSQLGNLIDQKMGEKLEEHEKKMMKEISALKERATALESANAETTMDEGHKQKRSRSAPPPKRTQNDRDDIQPIVVLAGFPLNSRKKEIEDYLKNVLEEHMPDWKNCTYFAPAVRTSIAIIKMNDHCEVKDFIEKWRELNLTFKSCVIRARPDKTPEQRKSNAKIFSMMKLLNQILPGKVIDPDWKKGTIWVEDAQVSQWIADTESWKWDENAMRAAGLDPTKAPEYETAAAAVLL